MIFSKVVYRTIQPVAFSKHPTTCGHLIYRPQKQASIKADQSIFGSSVVEISLLMELLIGNENLSLILNFHG